MKQIRNGAAIAKECWDALRAHPHLLLFPLLSFLALIAATVVAVIPAISLFIAGAATGITNNETASSVLGFVSLFLYYLITYTVIIYSNAALVGAVLRLIRGESGTVSDGMRIANARFGRILVYAAISATIGVLASSARSNAREGGGLGAILAAILGSIIQGAWSLIVFLAVPIMVAEDLSVKDTLKRSYEVFKRTWGEGFVGRTAISGIGCLVMFAVILVGGGLIALGVWLQWLWLIVAAAVLMVFAFAAIGLINGAINGIFQASLYHYAQTGDAGPFVTTELARDAFSPV